MREVLSELKVWTADREQIALATVVETWGSSPRPLGSKMVVTRSGKMAGSVSNGCIEGAVFEEAQKVLKAGAPNLAAFGVTPPPPLPRPPPRAPPLRHVPPPRDQTPP